MKLCMELYDRIENLTKIYNSKYQDIKFDIKHSNTTNSIYLMALSNGNGVNIKKKIRLSDHKNSDVRTKIITKNTKFSYIKRLFDSIANDVRDTRFRVLMNQIEYRN
jgi:hypothetical protein